MSKYNEYLDGMTLVDQALDESGYNYYGYIRTNGEWAIMRQKTDESEYRFKVGASGYSFSDRATYNYGLPTIG